MTLKLKVISENISNVNKFEEEFERAILELDFKYRRYTFKTIYQVYEDKIYAFIEYAPQPDPVPPKRPEEY